MISSSSYVSIAAPVKPPNAAGLTGVSTASDDVESRTDPAPDVNSHQADDKPGKPNAKNTIKTEKKITIKAEGRGFPNVNFKDGEELPVSSQETKGPGAKDAESHASKSDGFG